MGQANETNGREQEAEKIVEEAEYLVSEIWKLAGRVEEFGFTGAAVNMNIAADDLHESVDALRRIADGEEG